MPVVRRDQVCPTCGQCLNSGLTQEGFDELSRRNEEARVLLKQAKRADALEKLLWRNRWWFAPAMGIGGALLFLAVMYLVIRWRVHP